MIQVVIKALYDSADTAEFYITRLKEKYKDFLKITTRENTPDFKHPDKVETMSINNFPNTPSFNGSVNGLGVYGFVDIVEVSRNIGCLVELSCDEQVSAQVISFLQSSGATDIILE